MTFDATAAAAAVEKPKTKKKNPKVVRTTHRRQNSSSSSKSASTSILQSNPKYRASPRLRDAADKRDDDPRSAVQQQQQQQLPDPSCRRSGTTHSEDDDIPDWYIDTIWKGFGRNADLFRDVLQVSPDAEPRQLRICYFRRGRDVLTQSGVRGAVAGLGVLSSGGDGVPELARIRFQAVSMAYEIATQPAWRTRYFQYGLRHARDLTTTTTTTSCSRASPTQSTGTRNSVRWNEQVEELVYDRIPDEHHDEGNELAGRRSNKAKKNRRRKKTKIFIEDEEIELDEHLAKLDAEAEPTFVADFFDSLEESLDGFLQFAKGRDGTSDNRSHPKSQAKASLLQQQQQQQQQEEEDEEKEPKPVETTSSATTTTTASAEGFGGFIERVTSNDEDSIVGLLTSRFLGRSRDAEPSGTSKHQPVVVTPEHTKLLLPLSSSEEKDSTPFRCVSPDPCLEYDDDAPDDEEEDEIFDDSSIISFSSSVSGSSATSSDSQSIKSRPSEDDVFDGIEDELSKPPPQQQQPSTISLTRRRPSSPGNISTVSDLSGSVANRGGLSPSFVLKANTTTTTTSSTTQTGASATNNASANAKRSQTSRAARSITPVVPEGIFDEVPYDDVFEDDDHHNKWCEPSEVIQSLSFCEVDEEEDEKNVSKGTKDSMERQQQPRYSENEGFLQYFLAYVEAIVEDCEAMGTTLSEMDWKDAVLGPFMVEDEHVGDLMQVVSTELNKTPALHSADAMEAPTQLAIEAARSFSS